MLTNIESFINFPSCGFPWISCLHQVPSAWDLCFFGSSRQPLLQLPRRSPPRLIKQKISKDNKHCRNLCCVNMNWLVRTGILPCQRCYWKQPFYSSIWGKPIELREAPGLTCKKKGAFAQICPNLNTDCFGQSGLRDFESMSSSKESQVLLGPEIYSKYM